MPSGSTEAEVSAQGPLPGWPSAVSPSIAWDGAKIRSEDQYAYSFDPCEIAEVEAALRHFKRYLCLISLATRIHGHIMDGYPLLPLHLHLSIQGSDWTAAKQPGKIPRFQRLPLSFVR
jgi:hypothetical protein